MAFLENTNFTWGHAESQKQFSLKIHQFLFWKRVPILKYVLNILDRAPPVVVPTSPAPAPPPVPPVAVPASPASTAAAPTPPPPAAPGAANQTPTKKDPTQVSLDIFVKESL